jgi:hypothetical protein
MTEAYAAITVSSPGLTGRPHRHTRAGGYPVITAVHEISRALEYWIIRFRG